MSFKLTTERLILQIEDSSKAPEVLAFYQKNKELFEHFEPTRHKTFYTLDYQTASMNCEYNLIVKGKTLRYYIYRKEQPDVIIGSVSFARIEHGAFSRASIGYKFDKDYHHQGYAFEACQAAIHVLFTNYKIHRLDARVSPNNLPSILLLERLGFRYEGVEVNGSFQDHYRYGLISTIQ